MDTATLFYTIVSVVGAILIAVIGYFLKRTILMIDRLEEKTKKLDEVKVDRKDLDSLKSDVDKKVEKLADDIATIRSDYMTKEDFIREIAKLDRKIDQILDVLIKR